MVLPSTLPTASAGPDLHLVHGLETRLVNAWPSFEIELAEGWILRFAEGYSKRANAATPLGPSAGLDEPLLDHVERAYAERGLPACFRLTGLEGPGVDPLLADRGYAEAEPSCGMVAGLDDVFVHDDAVAIQPVAKPRWIGGAAGATGGDKDRPEILGRIVRAIRQPAGFATLRLDGEDAAWGFAVAERGRVGLYDIAVAPNLRGMGLGRRLVTSLLAWGREAGARSAYLQMREDNEIAGTLYRSLGFRLAYRYRHRVSAGAAVAAGR